MLILFIFGFLWVFAETSHQDYADSILSDSPPWIRRILFIAAILSVIFINGATPQYGIVSKIELENLSDTFGSSGYLHISFDGYYTYYIDNEYGYTLEKINESDNKVYVVEDSEEGGRLEKYSVSRSLNWKNYVFDWGEAGYPSRYEFHIPANSIQREFKLNAN